MFRICLFTAIEGTITDRGQPVIGALVERSAHLIFNNKTKLATHKDETDETSHAQN